MNQQETPNWDALSDQIFWLLEEQAQLVADAGAFIASGHGDMADRCMAAWERNRERLQDLRKQREALEPQG